MLLPTQRRILLNVQEATHGETPIGATASPSRTRSATGSATYKRPGCAQPAPLLPRHGPAQDADRILEREANVFAAELLMRRRRSGCVGIKPCGRRRRHPVRRFTALRPLAALQRRSRRRKADEADDEGRG